MFNCLMKSVLDRSEPPPPQQNIDETVRSNCADINEKFPCDARMRHLNQTIADRDLAKKVRSIVAQRVAAAFEIKNNFDRAPRA